jgi:hypothetical protein
MEQAIRGAFVEGGILDVLADDPCTLLVAAAKEIAAVMMVMIMCVLVSVVML